MPEIKFSSASPLKPRRRAILVGASSGIGASLARKLAREGYLVALLARREDMLEALCDSINESCGEIRAMPYKHDASNLKEPAQLFNKIVRDLGGLDCLIYNAGVLRAVGLKEFDLQKDLEMTQINYLGSLAWFNLAASYFQPLKTGQIVGIGSVAGDRGRVGAPAYNASKAAMHTYLEALRNRLTRLGINVLTIKPGQVSTDMLKNSPRTMMVISPEQAADGIWAAMRARKQVSYVPGQWGLLMKVIQHIPSFIFRRMSF